MARTVVKDVFPAAGQSMPSGDAIEAAWQELQDEILAQGYVVLVPPTAALVPVGLPNNRLVCKVWAVVADEFAFGEGVTRVEE